MARQIFVLDLKDEALAADYENWHQPGRVPRRVLEDIGASGITSMEIYRTGNRLIMVTETATDLAPSDRTGSAESAAWEIQMDAYQQPVGWAAPGVKWQGANLIFDLSDHI
ncbi:MAG: L-rhamnose mutarotase [Novosphingobium sp.]